MNPKWLRLNYSLKNVGNFLEPKRTNVFVTEFQVTVPSFKVYIVVATEVKIQ